MWQVARVRCTVRIGQTKPPQEFSCVVNSLCMVTASPTQIQVLCYVNWNFKVFMLVGIPPSPQCSNNRIIMRSAYLCIILHLLASLPSSKTSTEVRTFFFSHPFRSLQNEQLWCQQSKWYLFQSTKGNWTAKNQSFLWYDNGVHQPPGTQNGWKLLHLQKSSHRCAWIR